MGEQVAGAAGYGWLDGVRADLAREGYASRGVDIPACAVDAPHIRQRLYWVAVAHATDGGRQFFEDERSASVQPMVAGPGKGGEQSGDLRAGILRDMVNTKCQRLEGTEFQRERIDIKQISSNSSSDHMADSNSFRRSDEWVSGVRESEIHDTDGRSERIHMANANDTERRPHPEGRGNDHYGPDARREEAASGYQLDSQTDIHMADTDQSDASQERQQRGGEQCWSGGNQGSSFWSDHIWLTGADGKSRRSKPGLPLLAHGIPNRVGRLRAYGNAIVPPLAAEVIKAYMETQS
jgi:DNA (cytosine-5)-methyltransferase 1